MSTIKIAALLGYEKYPSDPSDVNNADSISYALDTRDLPHGAWLECGCKYEITTFLVVDEDSLSAQSARHNSSLCLNDTDAMNQIAKELSVPSWSADTIEWVAEIVVATGRSFACEDEDDDE